MSKHDFPSIHWTLQEAQAAQVAAKIEGPNGPFFQWIALHRLEELRGGFDGGDRFALMSALRVCANHDLPMPEWVAKGYIAGFDAVLHFRAESWDEVFGRPFPNGKQIARAREKDELKFAIFNRVMELRKQGRFINATLFREVGAALGIGKTKAEEYYRAALAVLQKPMNPNVDALLEPFMTPAAKRARATRKVQRLRGSR